MGALLEIRDLSISYKNQGLVVKNVSFEINKGEIISIVGESGSGKSTLIRSVLGLLSQEGKITNGDIFFLGKNISDLRNRELNKLRGSSIGMIFQDAGASMNPIRNIESQFLEYIRIHRNISKKEAGNIIKTWFIKLKLEDTERILASYPFELSGGMKQRIAIAMAMAQNPKLLLADEPTSALDVTIQAQVIKELKKIKEIYNTSIIIVTHNMGVAAYLSDKIAVMKNGELIEFGFKDKIIGNPENEYTKILLKSVPILK